jgi:hypothetical protein
MSLLWFFWCIGHIILMALMVFMTHPFYGYVEDTPFYGSFVVYDTPLLWFFLCRGVSYTPKEPYNGCVLYTKKNIEWVCLI